MPLTRERLTWAGTLAIVGAVLVLPMIAFNIWLNTVSEPMGGVLLFVRGCLLLPISIFLLVTLRRLLNERVRWHELDRLIAFSIWFNVANVPLASLFQLLNDKGLALGYEVLVGLIGAAIGIMMALRLFDLSDPLLGLRRSLACMWMATGIGTVVYCVVGAMAAMLGKQGGLLGLVMAPIFILDIIVLIVAGIGESIIQARIFFRAADAPGEAQPPQIPVEQP